MEYLQGYNESTLTLLIVTEATAHAVAAEHPYSTLNGTPTCSNHSGTALYKTSIVGQEESGCVHTKQFRGSECE